MALRDKLAQNVQPHLQPGETLQSVFSAQTFSQYKIALGLGLGILPGLIFMLSLNRYRVIAVTDRRIAVFDSGPWSATKTKRLLADINRNTVLGPTDGMWHKFQAGHETLHAHRRFYKDIAQADALVTGAAPPA